MIETYFTSLNPDWGCRQLECEVTGVKLQRHVHLVSDLVDFRIAEADESSERISEPVYNIIKKLLK